MKKITLLLLTATFIVSCGKSKEEQMLYDYRQKESKALNFDLKDLDFDIKLVEKIEDIKAQDSMKYLKRDLAELWKQNPEQSLIDTLSFDHVKEVLNTAITQQDTLNKLYHEAVLSAIKSNNYSGQYEYKRKRDKAREDMLSYQKELLEVKNIEWHYNELAKNPDSILTSKYKATYTMNNPLMGNAKQTFDKILYTNSAQTEFIMSEGTNED